MEEPAAPFDEFGHSQEDLRETPRGFLSSWTRAGLRSISLLGLISAFATAVLIVAFHGFRVLGGTQPAFLPILKSAIPLIAIGISYISLVFTIPRTAAQRVLGVLVGLAFVLWGAEQFIGDAGWVSLIDDVVVFLFVLDLSIVIRENLTRSATESRRRKELLPVKPPDGSRPHP
jgi:hypothetical protein